MTKRLFCVPNIVLALLCLMYFITYVDRVNISTAASEIQTEFGFSNTQLGLIFSAFAYPYLLFQVIGGWVGDRFGARKTLFWCGLVWALATMLTGFVNGLVTLFLVRVLVGLGEGATFPPPPGRCRTGPRRRSAVSPKASPMPSPAWAMPSPRR